MSSVSRVILIVLDGLGVGALPDAASYGDREANTLGHLLENLDAPPLPNLERLGLLRTLPGRSRASRKRPLACYGRMLEQSRGKDSTTGHWELMGIITRRPFPTYPKGFPRDLIQRFEKAIGSKVLGNCTASGTEIIEELGKKHIATGCPIVYTSADSVFQIAAHGSRWPLARLYKICRIARGMLVGRHAVGRVIARPFVGKPGRFRRSAARKDFALRPAGKTVLDRLTQKGIRTVGIGKIGDLFNDQGLTHVLHTKGNADGVDRTHGAIRREHRAGLIFTNLVDTDMLWGHRNNPLGYYRCLREFDQALPSIIDAMAKEDVLMITSDHGCDPTIEGTDHTREYVPLLVYGKSIAQGLDLGTRKGYADVGQTILELLGQAKGPAGKSFAKTLTG